MSDPLPLLTLSYLQLPNGGNEYDNYISMNNDQTSCFRLGKCKYPVMAINKNHLMCLHRFKSNKKRNVVFIPNSKVDDYYLLKTMLKLNMDLKLNSFNFINTARFGYIKQFKLLSEKYKNIPENCVDYAISSKNMEMVEYLLSSGYKLSSRAYEIALTNNDFEAVKYLYEKGIEYDICELRRLNGVDPDIISYLNRV